MTETTRKQILCYMFSVSLPENQEVLLENNLEGRRGDITHHTYLRNNPAERRNNLLRLQRKAYQQRSHISVTSDTLLVAPGTKKPHN